MRVADVLADDAGAQVGDLRPLREIHLRSRRRPRKGTLVLHEAGLQCPQPGVGPQVKAVWAADGADSTGIFTGTRGQGSDTAYPLRNTAAPQGTLTLSR